MGRGDRPSTRVTLKLDDGTGNWERHLVEGEPVQEKTSGSRIEAELEVQRLRRTSAPSRKSAC